MFYYDGKHPHMWRFVEAYTPIGKTSKMYIFQRPVPNDSRVDQVICTPEWFWTGAAESH